MQTASTGFCLLSTLAQVVLMSAMMTVSRVPSHSPVAIGAPVTSPPLAPDEPVKLCETCCKAHYAALRDDGTDWEQTNDHVQLNVARTETQTLHMYPQTSGLIYRVCLIRPKRAAGSAPSCEKPSCPIGSMTLGNIRLKKILQKMIGRCSVSSSIMRER